ncbi:Fe3+ ABC transporter permease [Alkalispirochaeta sphaeroplastigenens]|uniref:Fe3+ ABC transporter permease n=1 Tax=Alkalispirochaeta sphaeroplastigenens TaxID=1187066 RepID=A0A2S4JX49_9SPIO|nr:iron ABC transporter permease [Alkalispirochaeta sphaeroplastigenens]POR04109.1 Fe3+ ABC transporter permease [Alkalispirochaeta sphaeroplastigenens]
MGRRPALTLLVFLALLVPPVVAVLGAGVLDRGLSSWATEALRVLSRPSTWRSLRFGLVQAALSATISLGLALPGAYFLANLRFPGRRVAESLTLLPFVLPGLVVILAVISFYGRQGVVNRILGTDLTLVYSAAGIIIAHVMFNYAVALRTLAGGWRNLDERLREVSLSLGESSFGRGVRLYAPLLMPSLLSAWAVVFLYCFVSFGVVLVFGGVRYATLEVRIFQEMFTNLNLGAAGVLAFLQLLLCAAVVLLLQLLADRHVRPPREGRTRTIGLWNDASRTRRLVCSLYWGFLGFFLFGPLAAILVRSLRPGGISPSWSLEAFRALRTGRIGEREVYEIIRATFPEVVATSLAIAALSALATVLISLAAARSLRGLRAPWVDTMTKMPLAVSSVTFSLGMRLLWRGMIPPGPLIVITQTVMAFPLVFTTVRGALEAIPLRYLETARSLGASRWSRITTVELPLLRRGLVNAYTFAFALSLADFTAVLTIGRGEVVTFPVAMYRLIGFQSFDVALALGVWYILVVAAAFLVIDATSASRSKEWL